MPTGASKMGYGMLKGDNELVNSVTDRYKDLYQGRLNEISTNGGYSPATSPWQALKGLQADGLSYLINGDDKANTTGGRDEWLKQEEKRARSSWLELQRDMLKKQQP